MWDTSNVVEDSGVEHEFCIDLQVLTHMQLKEMWTHSQSQNWVQW